eukprot:CAMPEP_0197004008 /NCGR_PEP_ID=MMETSP1380-20130617/17429_1 /TAXON_ID=5936 /ORGANISM="Euplotes crassus, Strain CT5" /LENGTH=235 /DNA_ID=CAMNT_0042422649 /DNA_START=11 /DNA_END=718 /DNA_ORIENTATION=+
MYEQDREGVSGLRVMEGEDLGQGNRIRKQQIQQKDWLDQQIRLKQEQERIAKENQDEYEQQEGHLHDLLSKAQDDEEANRRAMAKAMMDENLVASKTKKDHEKYIGDRNHTGDNYDLDAANSDPFLNEHFGTTKNELGDHRYKPYHFKGLREDHKEQINLELKRQLEEAEIKKKQDKEEERLWALQAEHLRKLQIKEDRLLKRKKREMEEAALSHQVDHNKENKIKWKNPYGDRS